MDLGENAEEMRGRNRRGWAPAPTENAVKFSDSSFPLHPHDPEPRLSQETQDQDSSEVDEQRSSVSQPPVSSSNSINPPPDSPPSSFKSGEPEFSVSVTDFLKHSSEIHADIQSLTSLCQRLSPKPHESEFRAYSNSAETGTIPHEEVETKSSDSEKDLPDFLGLDKMLVEAGFRGLGIGENEVPAGTCLASALFEVLTQFGKLKKAEQMSTRKLQELAEKHKSLLISSEKLHSRVLKYKETERSQDSLLSSLKLNFQSIENPQNPSEQKPLEVFKRFFRRDYKAQSEADTKSMALILLYEDRVKRLEQDFKQVKTNQRTESVQQENAELIQKLMEEKEALKQVLSHAGEGQYDALEHMMGTQGPAQTLEAVAKMQSVIKTLPRIESFIKDVCFAVFPSLEIKESDTRVNCMDSLLPTLRQWRENLRILSSVHRSLCKLYRLSPNLEESDLLVSVPYR